MHRYGYWRFGRIGVIFQELTPELAEAFRIPATEGALVTGVEPRGPAAKAGLRRGDVILAVNGNRLAGTCDLSTKLVTSNPGDVLKFIVRRESAKHTIKVVTVEGKDMDIPEKKSDSSPEPRKEESKD